MANPYDPTLAHQFVRNYVAQHGSNFLRHAQGLGLPDAVAHAAASAVSEEMRNAYSADGKIGLIDRIVDPLASLDSSNESLARNFTDSPDIGWYSQQVQ